MGATESPSSAIKLSHSLHQSGHSVTPGSGKLDESDIRSLGHKHYSGVQNRILETAQSVESSNPTLPLREGDST